LAAADGMQGLKPILVQDCSGTAEAVP